MSEVRFYISIGGFESTAKGREIQSMRISREKIVRLSHSIMDVLYRKYYTEEMRRMGVQTAPEEHRRG